MRMTSWGGLGKGRRSRGPSTLWQPIGGRYGAEIFAGMDVALNINSVGNLPEQVRRPRGGYGRDVSTGSTKPAAAACPWPGSVRPLQTLGLFQRIPASIN